jgi:hypothetical protein
MAHMNKYMHFHRTPSGGNEKCRCLFAQAELLKQQKSAFWLKIQFAQAHSGGGQRWKQKQL